jgi:hypothetical protein
MWILALFLFAAATGFAQARLGHVWGRIRTMTKSGFEVDQNFNADPQSGYPSDPNCRTKEMVR